MSASAAEILVATSKLQGYRATLSPLYTLIAQLRREKHSSLQALEVKELKTQNAFLFTINSPLEEYWVLRRADLALFFLKERHFRIDETYKDRSAQHGLTPLHYTEIYGLPNCDREMVVHAFLNKKKQYIYSQVRVYDSTDRSGTFQEIKVDEALENTIHNNMRASIVCLAPIFDEWDNRCLLQEEKVQESIRGLENLSGQALIDKKSLKAYQEKFATLIQEMNVKDELRGEADRRRNVLFNLKSNIESWSNRIEEAISAASLPSVAETAASSSSLKSELLATNSSAHTRKNAETLQQLADSVLVELHNCNGSVDVKLFERSLTVRDLKMALKREGILARAEDLLLVLIGLSKSRYPLKKEKLQKLNDDINLKTTKHFEQCKALLRSAVFEGGFDALKPLFDLLKDKLSMDFYEEFIEKLVDSKDESEQKRLIAACDYFYENADWYRVCVSRMSAERSYYFPKTDPRCDNVGFDIQVSLLYKAHINKNRMAFEMLLKHGANPETWAVKKQDGNSNIFCLIYAIAVFKPSRTYGVAESSEFIRILLTYHARTDIIYAPERYKAIIKFRLEVARINRGRNSHPHQPLRIEHDDPLFIAMGRRYDVEGLDLMLPYTSIEDIALLLGEMSNYDSVTMYTCPAEKSFIGTYLTKEEGVRHYGQKPLVERRPFSCTLFFPGAEESELEKKSFVKKMNFLHVALKEKIKRLRDPLKLLCILDEFLRSARERAAEKDFRKADHFFVACEYLLAEEAGLLNLKNQLRFVEKLCVAVLDKGERSTNHTLNC